MNRSFLSVALILAITQAHAQLYTDVLLSRKWKPGKTQVMYDQTILKSESNSPEGFTNVCYQDSTWLIADIYEQAEKKMWSAAKLAQELSDFRENAPGGIVYVYVGRITIGSADMSYFTVVIKDSTGKEILRKEFEEDTPNTPGTDRLWWNLNYVSIPVGISKPFDIFVIDELDDDKPRHQFTVLADN